MKSTKVLTLSSVCKQNYCNCLTLITFSIVNFILSLDLLNIVNIFINIASYDMIKLMHFRADTDNWSWSSICMLISILTVLSIPTAVTSLTVVFTHTVVYILTVVTRLSARLNTVHALIFIDSFGKGFRVLKDHVLNRLMTGRCPRKSLQLRPKFHSLFLQNNFDFQKSVTFKGLKSSPRMY